MNKKTMMIALVAVLLVVVAVLAMNYAKVEKQDDPQMQVVEVQPAPVETVEIEAEPQAQTEETAEQPVEIVELSGEVIEVTQEYFVITDKVQGQVQVNVGDDTLFEGVEMGEIAVGQYALVMYDGKMTRSLPPQVYALKVGVYEISGKVTEAEDGSMTIAREELGDEVIVHLPEGMTVPAVGSEVIAYTTGMMTMSLPAQTTAIGVVIQ